jgi:hypothetical protein
MGNMLLAVAVGMTVIGICGSAHAAMQKADKPSMERIARPIECHGNRRSYRSFNHCWRVNRLVGYCSRICR